MTTTADPHSLDMFKSTRSGLAPPLLPGQPVVKINRNNGPQIFKGEEEVVKPVEVSTTVTEVSKGDVKFREIPEVSSENERLAIQINKKLSELDVTVTGSVALNLDSNRDEELYYECRSSVGDRFLMMLDMNDRADLLFVEEGSPEDGTTTKKSKNRVLMRANATIVPATNPDNGDCAKDPVCRRVFSCGKDGTCVNPSKEPSSQDRKSVV